MKQNQYSESKTQKKLRMNVLLNHPDSRNKTEKQSSRSSNQTPEFTLDSNTPQPMLNTEFKMMKGGMSKLSVTPFISPHRKEKPSNFVNFNVGRSPKKYTPINDNDMIFSPHKMSLKSNFIPFSGIKSNDLMKVDFTKFVESNQKELKGMFKDSLFIKTRNQYKEKKQKRQSNQ
jgi:hypothetical protein